MDQNRRDPFTVLVVVEEFEDMTISKTYQIFQVAVNVFIFPMYNK